MDGKQPYESRANSVAFERGLYSSEDLPDIQNIDQEADLGGIESLFAPRWPLIFDKIGDPISKMNIARYLAMQHLRHPARLAEIKRRNVDMLRLLSQVPKDQEKLEIKILTGEVIVVDKAEYRDFLGDPAQAATGSIEAMRTAVEQLAVILFNRKWGIIESEVPYFVTSDWPLKLLRGEATVMAFGFRTPGTEIFFPITPWKILIISDSWLRDSAYVAPENFPQFLSQTDFPFNLPQLKAASRFVFSSTPNIPGMF